VTGRELAGTLHQSFASPASGGHTGLSHKGFWSVLPLAGQHLLSTLAVRLDLVEPGRFKFRPYAASSIPVRIEDPPEHRRLGSRMARALLRFSATRAL